MCCQLSASARQQLADGQLTPALTLWREVVAASASSPYRKRLKCIMALTNPADCNLDAISSGLVKTYNAKPFMCRTTGAPPRAAAAARQLSRSSHGYIGYIGYIG